MSLMMQNSVLAQAEQKIEAQLHPETRDSWSRIVTAGMKMALSKGEDGLLAAMKDSQDPVNDAAKGAVGIVMVLRDHAKGQMPPVAMIPAMMTLMLKALDFADKAGIVKVSASELDQATKTFAETVMPAMGIGDKQMEEMTGKVHGIINDPGQMERVNRAAGVSRDPRAGTPTVLPKGV